MLMLDYWQAPHLNYLRRMAVILSLDAKRGAELNDGARVEADLKAILGLPRQMRESGGPLLTQLPGIDALAVVRLQRVLSEHPGVLGDAQLIQLAHTLSGPRVAADFVNLSGERCFFYDLVQRTYTDNGNGDGRMTLEGGQAAPLLNPLEVFGRTVSGNDLWIAAGTVPMAIASRVELMGTYNRLADESEAKFRQPLRQIVGDSVDAKIIALQNSPVDRVRYAMILTLFFSPESVQATCERYLGSRDGALVAISLELYHRRHGSYPSSLNELAPELLPEIPTDRITGDRGQVPIDRRQAGYLQRRCGSN